METSCHYSLQIQLTTGETKFYGQFASVDEAMIAAKSYSCIPTLNSLIGIKIPTEPSISIQMVEENFTKCGEQCKMITLSHKSVGYLVTSVTNWAKITPVKIVFDVKAQALAEETTEKMEQEESKKCTKPCSDNNKYAQAYKLVQEEIAQVLSQKFWRTSECQIAEKIPVMDEAENIGKEETKECYFYQFAMKDYNSTRALEVISYVCNNLNHLAFKSKREFLPESSIYRFVIWVNENDLLPIPENDIEKINEFIAKQKAEVIFRGPKGF